MNSSTHLGALRRHSTAGIDRAALKAALVDSLRKLSPLHAVRNPVIAIVSLGAPRPLRLRPRGAGRSLSWNLGNGDLLVMGGACQHDWEHTVPKVRVTTGPRMSVTFRSV